MESQDKIVQLCHRLGLVVKRQMFISPEEGDEVMTVDERWLDWPESGWDPSQRAESLTTSLQTQFL